MYLFHYIFLVTHSRHVTADNFDVACWVCIEILMFTQLLRKLEPITNFV